MSARDNGWYWVIFDGIKQPAYYYAMTCHWEICGVDAEFTDAALDRIGQQIEVPTEVTP